MKKREVKDLGASIRARLTNIAKETKRDFDALLLQYFQERFLYPVVALNSALGFIKPLTIEAQPLNQRLPLDHPNSDL